MRIEIEEHGMSRMSVRDTPTVIGMLIWTLLTMSVSVAWAQEAGDASHSQQASAQGKGTEEIPASEVVAVYLLGGQSNMQGSGQVAELPEAVRETELHSFFWNGESFEPLVIGKTKTSANVKRFGPEVGLSLTFDRDSAGYLIKYHASGMPLHQGWNGNKWEGPGPGPQRRNFYPGENDDDPNCGTLYRAMVQRFRAGLQHLRDSGKTPEVKGFLWMQGEQDAKHQESASRYAVSLKRLRDRVADDLNLERLPLVFGQVLPHEPALPRFTYRAEIRQSMAAADADSGKDEAIPHAKMVSTDGMPLLKDTVHYNAEGQLQLGQAMAKTLQEVNHSQGKE